MYIAPGRYRHYKGQLYEVMGIARHSETEEQLVVYRALYGDFGLWVRPLSLFNETVEKAGKMVARFAYLQSQEQTEGQDAGQARARTAGQDATANDAEHSFISSVDHEITHEMLEAEKVVHERYEWLHIVNDYSSALLFLVGSILFLWKSTVMPATWLFIIGSVVFLNGPFLRTLNKRYVKHLRKDPIHW